MQAKLFQNLAPFAAAALLAACAGTPGGSTSRSRTVEEGAAPAQYADQNRDGQVSREEAGVDKYLLEEFDVLDLDKDGVLSAAEFERLSARRADRPGTIAVRAEPGRRETDAAEASEPAGQTLNRSGR